MITAIIPTLPVALMPAGLMPTVLVLGLLAVAAGFAALVTSMVREDAAAAVRATPARVSGPMPLPHAA
jgi:hypothetical protein